MLEDPIPILTRFHRELLLPDVERVVADSERRLRDEMQALCDALAQRSRSELGAHCCNPSQAVRQCLQRRRRSASSEASGAEKGPLAWRRMWAVIALLFLPPRATTPAPAAR